MSYKTKEQKANSYDTISGSYTTPCLVEILLLLHVLLESESSLQVTRNTYRQYSVFKQRFRQSCLTIEQVVQISTLAEYQTMCIIPIQCYNRYSVVQLILNGWMDYIVHRLTQTEAHQQSLLRTLYLMLHQICERHLHSNITLGIALASLATSSRQTTFFKMRV